MKHILLAAVLVALAVSASAADESISHPLISVVDQIGLSDQTVENDVNGILDLAPAARGSIQIVAGYRDLELDGDEMNEYSLGVGLRHDTAGGLVLRAGVGIRLRDGSDTIATEQDVTTVTHSTVTTTTTTVTPSTVHTPHGPAYGWHHHHPVKPPTVTTVTTSHDVTTTSTATVYGQDSERVRSSLFGYASLDKRIGLGVIDAVGHADAMLLRDGYELNCQAGPAMRLLGCAVDVHGLYRLTEYWGDSAILASVEDQQTGFGIGAAIRVANLLIGADYLFDQQSYTGTVALSF